MEEDLTLKIEVNMAAMKKMRGHKWSNLYKRMKPGNWIAIPFKTDAEATKTKNALNYTVATYCNKTGAQLQDFTARILFLKKEVRLIRHN